MWRLVIPKLRSYHNLSSPSKKPRTKMEVAGIVALSYVGGMTATAIIGCLCTPTRQPTGQIGDGFLGVFEGMMILAIAVFWPITVPVIVVGTIYDNLPSCKKNNNNNNNN